MVSKFSKNCSPIRLLFIFWEVGKSNCHLNQQGLICTNKDMASQEIFLVTAMQNNIVIGYFQKLLVQVTVTNTLF